MKKESVTIFRIGGIIVLILLFVFIVTDNDLFNPQTTRDIQLSKIIPENKKAEIFEMMASPEQYPNIFPRNFLKVTIINKTDSVIFAKEIISEQEITKQIFVKHEIFPPDQQTIEILDGDFEGTKINVLFVTDDLVTSVNSKMHLNVSGPLAYIINLIEQKYFDSLYGRLIGTFVNYG